MQAARDLDEAARAGVQAAQVGVAPEAAARRVAGVDFSLDHVEGAGEGAGVGDGHHGEGAQGREGVGGRRHG